MAAGDIGDFDADFVLHSTLNTASIKLGNFPGASTQPDTVTTQLVNNFLDGRDGQHDWDAVYTEFIQLRDKAVAAVSRTGTDTTTRPLAFLLATFYMQHIKRAETSYKDATTAINDLRQLGRRKAFTWLPYFLII